MIRIKRVWVFLYTYKHVHKANTMLTAGAQILIILNQHSTVLFFSSISFLTNTMSFLAVIWASNSQFECVLRMSFWMVTNKYSQSCRLMNAWLLRVSRTRRPTWISTLIKNPPESLIYEGHSPDIYGIIRSPDQQFWGFWGFVLPKVHC